MKTPEETQIAQAVARGYCYQVNSKKVLDPNLIEAMAEEVYRWYLARVDEFNAERNAPSDKDKLARWMVERNYITGHGDTMEELLRELGEQVQAVSERNAPGRADYEEVLEDHKRLVREIDEIINGKEGMAKQASLCDLIPQIEKLAARKEINPEFKQNWTDVSELSRKLVDMKEINQGLIEALEWVRDYLVGQSMADNTFVEDTAMFKNLKSVLTRAKTAGEP